MNEGFIQLHRKILNWEWYSDHNTTRLFIHCILKANFKEKQWQGLTIERGVFITSLEKLSAETGLSLQSVRTSLKKLERTGEIIKKSTNKLTYITVCNYDSYQGAQHSEQQTNNKQITNEQQTNNKRITTTNNDNKEKNVNNEKNEEEPKVRGSIDFDLFLSDFNNATGKNKRVLDSKTKRQIKERIKDGYFIEEIIKAAKNCSNDDFHKKNPKYLTPEFITRPAMLQKYVDADVPAVNQNNEIFKQTETEYNWNDF